MILILSNDTNYDRGFLNYEIEKAFDYYKLPLVITYPGVEGKINGKLSTLEKRWPKALKERLNDKSRDDLSCLHIVFSRDQISRALEHMTVHNKKYMGSKLY
ncbi:hypothetical protein [Priestia aryabhattai]|uniref:hypothetical protein n=1 Tax=Priestia aryabhattai TaxID=412384 RepID=UPI003735B2C2